MHFQHSGGIEMLYCNDFSKLHTSEKIGLRCGTTVDEIGLCPAMLALVRVGT